MGHSRGGRPEPTEFMCQVHSLQGGSLNSLPFREPLIPLGNGALIALLSSARLQASLELTAVSRGEGRVCSKRSLAFPSSFKLQYLLRKHEEKSVFYTEVQGKLLFPRTLLSSCFTQMGRWVRVLAGSGGRTDTELNVRLCSNTLCALLPNGHKSLHSDSNVRWKDRT